jgi:hypothetical protein
MIKSIIFAASVISGACVNGERIGSFPPIHICMHSAAAIDGSIHR